MAVLKSFDLEGNKQSFAGWISNLSPCDTPFVSMVNKEATSQTQYSWQFDALEKPSTVAGYEEGSDAVSQVRGVTEVDYNFTSVLRKVVNISDTVSAMSTHGRNSEIAYQMGKSGKELKRDMEFMCLNNKAGNIGSKDTASKFSGFQGLVSTGTDAATGAKVVKEVNVGDLKGVWFKPSDVFDVTYNLYLAGSKANKIMFHPRHALTFSRFMSANIESPMTYRMFDGLAEEFNTKVSTLRDPLGQKYDLIPNRFMPEDAIYFFNEADWTQMILRSPVVSPLGKKGSSDRFLMESEVGLRHRNPFASGILKMEPSTLIFEWVSKPTPMTWGIGADEEAIVSIKVRATGANVPDGTTINWASSNPLVVEVADPTGQTNAGQALVLLKPQRAGTSVITASHADGHVSYIVTVADPGIKLRLASNLIEKDKGTLAIVHVTHADGSNVKDGIVVDFTANPGNLINMPAKSSPTAGGSGTAQVEINAAGILGLVQVQAHIGTTNSNYARLEIVDKVEALIMTTRQDNIANGINDSSIIEIMVVDATGAPIPNQSVSLMSTDATVITIGNTPIDTGATGVYNLRLTAAGVGDAVIVGQYKGQIVEIPMAVTDPVIDLGCPANAVEGTAFNMSAVVTRGDGTTVQGVDVSFVGDPIFAPAVADVTTDVNGVARASYTPTSNSDIEITANIGVYVSNTCNVAVDVP